MNTSNLTSEISRNVNGNIWWFKQIFPMVILLFGLFGNTMVILILNTKKYVKTSTSTIYYMKALALSDNFVIFLLFIRWLNKIPNSPIKHNSYFCVLYFFSVRLGLGMSAWTVMFMSADRYICIRFPLRAKILCSIKRTRICLVGISIVQVVSHLPYFWRYANPDALTLSGKCPYNLPKTFAIPYQILRMVLFDRILPWLIILIFAISITIKLRRDDVSRMRTFQVKVDRQILRKVTSMSISVAWMFFCLTFPTTVYEAIRVTYTKVSLPPFLYELFVYFLYLNSAVNFYLYMVIGTQFRNDFKCCVSKLVWNAKLTPANTHTNTSGVAITSF